MKKNFLTDNEGNKSMMRLAMLSVIIMAMILFLAMAGYMVLNALKGNEINFGGMAGLVGALSAFIGTLVIGKSNQKGKELKAPRKDKDKAMGKPYESRNNVDVMD